MQILTCICLLCVFAGAAAKTQSAAEEKKQAEREAQEINKLKTTLATYTK
jgi:hypothetical protein